MDSFAFRIKQERKRLGLTQVQFAKLGGVEPNAQRNYESGRRWPKADYLQRLSQAGINMAYVFATDQAADPDGPEVPEEPKILMRSNEAITELVAQSGQNLDTTLRAIYYVALNGLHSDSSAAVRALDNQMKELRASAAQLINSALKIVSQAPAITVQNGEDSQRVAAS